VNWKLKIRVGEHKKQKSLYSGKQAVQLPKIAQSLSTLLNHRHALAPSFLGPAHWNPMQWDSWAGHERRVAFWFSKYQKKNTTLKTSGKENSFYNDFSKKF